MAGPRERGETFQITANNATSAVASKTGIAGRTIYITTLTASTDKAGGRVVVQDGATVIFQDRVSTASGYVATFDVPLKCTVGSTLTITTDGTAECNSNAVGFITG
jgi:hypothetical protein